MGLPAGWQPGSMLHCSFLIYPQALGSSIALPMEMLAAADKVHRARERCSSLLQVQVVGTSLAPVTTSGGLIIQPHTTLAQSGDCDLILLPALWGNPRKLIRQQTELIDWLRERGQGNSLICAVGTGSCLLAEAGLLDNKPATTHWHYFNEFEKHYPQVELHRRHLITQSDRLFCAGSVNSIADLMIHFVERFYGQRVARAIENHFSPEIRQSYESHLYSESRVPAHPDEDIVRAQYWLQSYQSRNIRIRDLAAYLNLSQRSLNRRFKAATGYTPLAYLQLLRMETARELLRDSNLSIAEIADQVGFVDASRFSATFRKVMQQTPLSYRQLVRGKLFNAGDRQALS